jgi:renalase
MPTSHNTDVLIIGAGLAGLSAANDLRQAGRKVLVIDKGRGLGGTAVAKFLATGIHVMRTTRVDSIGQQGNGWLAELDNGETVNAKAMLITSPIPQTIDLLATGKITVPTDKQTRLNRIQYESCIAVMAILDRPTAIESPGAIALEDGPIAWITDNLQKGVSKIPAVTIHASGDFSAEHLNHDRMEIGQRLIDAAGVYLGDARVTEYQLHGWRYSKPIVVDDAPCILLSETTDLPPLAVAGDAFAGPRFEGAVQSGWAAAKALMNTNQ